MKFLQIVMGAAGAGKSTYCQMMQEHGQAVGRTIHVGNLDPAAEKFGYEAAFDVKSLISVEDVMEELGFGPNGALVYAMEYLGESMDWLEGVMGEFGEDDYLLLDCPGQVELYTHIPVFRRLLSSFVAQGWNVCGVYLVDGSFSGDASKFLSAQLMALAAMVHLEVPHHTILSKCDLVAGGEEEAGKWAEKSGEEMLMHLPHGSGGKWGRLNTALATLLDDYSMVQCLPLDATNEDSVARCLAFLDRSLQFGEDMEMKDPDRGEDGGGGEAGGGGGM